MNDSPNLPGPPFGDDTDEALSALVDGELAPFAAERGLTEAATRARLEAWPETEARLAELSRIRAAVQAPVSSLDDVTRRRLLRGASDVVAASPSTARRSRSWVAITAVAAAALLAVAGIGAAISSIGGGDGTSSSKSAASSPVTGAPLAGDVGNLGDVTSATALRALLDRRQAAGAGAKSAPTVAPGPESAASATAGDTAGNTAGNTPGTTANSVDPAACALKLAGSRRVAFSGTGTYRGTPVAIVGIAEGGRTIVFVVSSTDCTKVLASISR